jgi:hypothetical protein
MLKEEKLACNGSIQMIGKPFQTVVGWVSQELQFYKEAETKQRDSNYSIENKKQDICLLIYSLIPGGSCTTNWVNLKLKLLLKVGSLQGSFDILKER